MHRLPFYIEIDEGVYPVCEDTLLLLDAVDVKPGERFLEVGCGAGLIGIHASANGAVATLVDVNPAAVHCARRNLEECKVKAQVVESELFEDLIGVFDVIAFNPPYLPGSTAGGDIRLDGGDGGVETVLRFLDGMREHLAPDGRAYILLSNLSQRQLLDSPFWFWKAVASKPLFFETLTVYTVTHSPDPPPHPYMSEDIVVKHGK